MKPSNDNTVGGVAANDNAIVTPRIESVPDLDEQEFEAARNGYNRMMSAIEQGMIGRWYGMPEDKAPPRYAYTRAGIRGKPGTMEREAILRNFGFRPAPKGTQCGGFLTDGENGSYWYAPIDLYQRMKTVQREAAAKEYAQNMRAALRRPSETFYEGADGEQLARHGVEIGVSNVATGSATFDEVAEAERAARARKARSR